MYTLESCSEVSERGAEEDDFFRGLDWGHESPIWSTTDVINSIISYKFISYKFISCKFEIRSKILHKFVLICIRKQVFNEDRSFKQAKTCRNEYATDYAAAAH